jgi:hypothetical protein
VTEQNMALHVQTAQIAGSYIRLRNTTSGPEIVIFGIKTGTCYRKTHWNGRGAKPLTFASGFCGGRRPFKPPKYTISGPETLLSNLENTWPNCDYMTHPAALEKALRPTKSSSMGLALAVASS